MSRPVILLIVVLAILVGGLFLLAGRATERPLVPVEKSVSLANLT
ncbi:hypothetical protein [uncultured Sphingomonas sp.]